MTAPCMHELSKHTLHCMSFLSKGQMRFASWTSIRLGNKNIDSVIYHYANTLASILSSSHGMYQNDQICLW
jgi:hypothetical protein